MAQVVSCEVRHAQAHSPIWGFASSSTPQGFFLLTTIAFIQAAIAQSPTAHTDVEVRLGAGMLCGTCTDNDEGLRQTIKMTAQIFADTLFPVTTIGDGAFEIGPYAKGALLDGINVPLIAGGVVLGYGLAPMKYS